MNKYKKKDNTKSYKGSLFYRIRVRLIRLLAGKIPVLLNLTFSNKTGIDVDVSGGVICNCYFNATEKNGTEKVWIDINKKATSETMWAATNEEEC